MKRIFSKIGIIFLMALVFGVLSCGRAYAENIKINNTTLNFNKIIYVDNTNGNDSTGDGSISKPFLTFDKAYENSSDNYAIALGDGVYNANNYTYNYINSKKAISIIGNADKTTLVFPSIPDGHYSPEGTLKFYRLKLTFKGSAFAGFCGDNDTPKAFVYFYNVYFVDTNNTRPLEGGDWGSTGSSSRYNFYFNNSSFQVTNNWLHANLNIVNSSINQPSFGLGILVSNQNSLYNAKHDTNGLITNDGWKNTGINTNPDGSKANIGVYGGEYAWGSWNAPSTNAYILNIEPAKNKIKKNETVTASLTIDNITNIAAEDVKITYDAEKLQFVGAAEVDGIKLVKNDAKAGELRFILASKGAANVVNAKKILLNLSFKGIKAGDALVDVVKGKVSDGITSEDNLSDAQCGQATITIEDMKDVNNSGEFTLLDLAIDGRHLGEAPATLPQYNTDIVVNSAIDDADLLEIGNQMLANPNYTL